MKHPAATPRRFPLSRLVSARPLSKSATEQLLRAHGFCDTATIAAALPRLHSNDQQRRTLAKLLPHLARVCAASADPDRVFINFERLAAALPHPNMLYHYLLDAPEALDMLAGVFAHSQALSDTLARNAGYFHFLISPETLRAPRSQGWLHAELDRQLLASRVLSEKYDIVRRFRRRETLRIGARDLVGRATVEETTLELANLADVCLEAVFEIALALLSAQFKLTGAARETARRFSIIGMGKLGGQELNYSSDVDVIFLYDDDGPMTPMLSRLQFFTKLSEEIIRAVARQTDEGTIFRIDLRLRPEGSTVPSPGRSPTAKTTTPNAVKRGSAWPSSKPAPLPVTPISASNSSP